MAGIQLSGLASGFDWKSLVDQLIAADRAPQDRLRAQKTANTNRVSALNTLGARLGDLQAALSPLRDGTLFSARTVALGDAQNNTTWTARVDAGASVGSHVVDVERIATSSRLLGAAHVAGPLSATADVSQTTLATLPTAQTVRTGDFRVNGATVNVALSDSLQDVFDKIATATNGRVAAHYDPTADAIALQSNDGSEIMLGGANDTSNFLAVAKLSNNGTGAVASRGALGTVNLTAPLERANLRGALGSVDAAGNGSFSVNGVAVAYNVHTDSLQTVLGRLNGSAAGVRAAYDPTRDRVVLSNTVTGDLGLGVTDTTGGLLGALGVAGAGSGATLERGQDARFTVDGGDPILSARNTLDAGTTGIAGLTLTVDAPGRNTVGVSVDTATPRAQIEAFIAKFNAVQSFIADQTKVTRGTDGTVTSALLANNHEVAEMGRSLRALAFSTVASLSAAGNASPVQRLQSLGIDFTAGTAQLTVKDSAALDRVLSTHGTDVNTLFADASGGLAAQLNGFVDRVTGDGGTLKTQTTSLTNQSSRLDRQIADLERRLTAERSLLESSFIRMEQLQSQLQGQSQVLTKSFSS